MSRNKMSKRSSRVALGGILTALSLLLLYFASLIPSGQIGVVALAGLVPIAGVLSGGFATGFLCYAATGILGFLLLPGKGCALLYVILLGLYPVLKGVIERLRKLPVELVLKLVYFNAVISALFFGFSKLFFPLLPELLHQPLWLYVEGNIVFLIYDFGVSKLITYYVTRIRPAIRKH